MKLPFSVIKNDIHKGYKYLDYGEITYKGYNVHTILDREEVLYFITDEGRQVTVHFERNEFLRLKYGILANIVMTHIYYNMVDKLED